MKRHNRDDYHIAGEGILTVDDHGNAAVIRPSSAADARKFRFSRLGPQGEPVDDAERMIFESVATAMTEEPPGGDPDSAQAPDGRPASRPGSPTSASSSTTT